MNAALEDTAITLAKIIVVIFALYGVLSASEDMGAIRAGASFYCPTPTDSPTGEP